MKHQGDHQANGGNGEGAFQGEAAAVGLQRDRFLEFGHLGPPPGMQGLAKVMAMDKAMDETRKLPHQKRRTMNGKRKVLRQKRMEMARARSKAPALAAFFVAIATFSCAKSAGSPGLYRRRYTA